MFKTSLLATMAVSSVSAVELETSRRAPINFMPGLDLLRQEGKKSGIKAATNFLNFWTDNDGFKEEDDHDFFFIDDDKFGGFFGGKADNDLIPKFLFEDELYHHKHRRPEPKTFHRRPEPKTFGIGRTRIQPKVKADVVVVEAEEDADTGEVTPKVELKTSLNVDVTESLVEVESPVVVVEHPAPLPPMRPAPLPARLPAPEPAPLPPMRPEPLPAKLPAPEPAPLPAPRPAPLPAIKLAPLPEPEYFASPAPEPEPEQVAEEEEVEEVEVEEVVVLEPEEEEEVVVIEPEEEEEVVVIEPEEEEEVVVLAPVEEEEEEVVVLEPEVEDEEEEEEEVIVEVEIPEPPKPKKKPFIPIFPEDIVAKGNGAAQQLIEHALVLNAGSIEDVEEPLTDLVEVIMKVIAGGPKPAKKPAVATYVEDALNVVTSDSGAVLAAFVDEVKSNVIDSVKAQKEQIEIDAEY